MALHLISTGLGFDKNLTIRAINTLKTCNKIFIHWKSAYQFDNLAYFESIINSKIEILFDHVNYDELIEMAHEHLIAILVSGDPLSYDICRNLYLGAKKRHIKVGLIHNASIFNTIAKCGLQCYKFGRKIIIDMKRDGILDEIVSALKSNFTRKLHTLFVLDISLNRIPEITGLTSSNINQLDVRKISPFEFINSISSNIEQSIQSETLILLISKLGLDNESIVVTNFSKLKRLDSYRIYSNTDYNVVVIVHQDLHSMEVEYLLKFAQIHGDDILLFLQNMIK